MENDRRTKRTKKLLKKAYIELLSQKKFTDISVKELCDLADINRGTFYLHYVDIYDLKAQLEEEIVQYLEDLLIIHTSLKTSNDAYALFLDLFQFTEENADFFNAVLGHNSDISFLKRMQTLFKERYLDILFEGKTPNNSNDLEYSYNFIASGFTGLIESWLSTPNHPSPEEMARLINRIVYDGLPSLLSYLN